MKSYWVTVFVEVAILGSVLSFGGDCLKAQDHFQITADEFMLYNVSTVYPNFTCISLTLPNRNTTYSSVLLQYHVWNSNVIASLYAKPRPEYAVWGDHIGLIWPMNRYQHTVQSYVTLASENLTTTEALILYTPLNDSVPMPGACNMESNPEIDPNLKIIYQVENVLINVTFSMANVGYKPSSKPPDCQGSAPRRNVLRYDLYMMFIEWNKYSKGSLFSQLKKMMTVEGMMEHGQKIHTFGKNDKLDLRLAMFNGRGVILNVIARDSQTGMMSPYTPAVTYACGNNHGSLCYERASALDCYTCNDCKSFFSYSSRSEKCQEPIISLGALTEQQCFKQVESDGTINRGCLTQTQCITQETISKCREGTKGCYTCCDKPDCNSASFLSVSMATLVLSTVLAILRML